MDYSYRSTVVLHTGVAARQGHLEEALTGVEEIMRGSARQASKGLLRGWYVHAHKGKKRRAHVRPKNVLKFNHTFENCFPQSTGTIVVKPEDNIVVHYTLEFPPPTP